MKTLTLIFFSLSAFGQSLTQLEGTGVILSAVDYQGKKAIRVLAKAEASNGSSYAVIKGESFHNGTLEVDVAGKPAEGAGEAARGFIGLAFRTQGVRYEYIYLRPTNGRASDQVRRNHSTQYSSHPDYGFDRLRREAPEKYESYVDLEPGVWTHVKIVVEGQKALLYVNNAQQPCLVVNDLKLGDATGGVALWVGPGTDGYFANLQLSSK